MKIIYGVQGTGNGHISRSRELVGELKGRGHEVHTIFSGRDPTQIFGIDIFRPYTAFKGLSFAVHDGKIDRLKTALSLDLRQFYRDIGSFDPSGYDLAIVDFEPVTSRMAQKHGLPSIGIGHQYAFVHDIPTPGGCIVDRHIMKIFAPADHNFGLHWHHFGKPILPPIIPRMKRGEVPADPKKIIVYLLFEDNSAIADIFRGFPEYEFHIYTKTDSSSDDANLHFRPLSRENFLRDLKESSGVITNAGFELPSEAIHLGKKLLVKAVAGQFEQEANGIAIERLGYGLSVREINADSVGKWLNEFRSQGRIFPESTVPEIAAFIETGKWTGIESLAERLWGEKIG